MDAVMLSVSRRHIPANNNLSANGINPPARTFNNRNIHRF